MERGDRMDLNEAMAKEIARQLGLKENAGFNPADIRKLEEKSDAELEHEILKLREQLTAKGISRAKQASMLRSLLPMMDSMQKARLQKIIGLIER